MSTCIDNTCTAPATTNTTAVATPQDTHEQERYASPAVDIFESPNGLVVVADVPGLTEEDLSISVEKDVLTIKGTPPKGRSDDALYREFEATGYHRRFQLGKKIDQQNIQAEYKAGVLRITLPLAVEAKPRSIPVKVG